MNSLPTISKSYVSPDEDQQWNLIKSAIYDSEMNVAVINKIVEALLKINNAAGYGSINISVVGGYLQEFKVTTGERPDAMIIREIRQVSFLDSPKNKE